MSADKVSIETTYRVWDDDNGGYMAVGPDSDGLGLVRVFTEKGDPSEGYFGKFDFCVRPGYARVLAAAIIKAADDADKGVK